MAASLIDFDLSYFVNAEKPNDKDALVFENTLNVLQKNVAHWEEEAKKRPSYREKSGKDSYYVFPKREWTGISFFEMYKGNSSALFYDYHGIPFVVSSRLLFSSSTPERSNVSASRPGEPSANIYYVKANYVVYGKEDSLSSRSGKMRKRFSSIPTGRRDRRSRDRMWVN